MRVRSVVVDDHDVVRIGLRLLLETAGGFTVVGDAANGADALTECAKVDPDLVIIDLQMGGRVENGLDAIVALRTAHRRVRLLVLSQHTDDDTLFAALQAGAHGFCAKHDVQESLVRAARGVAAGEVHFGAGVAERALRLITAPGSARTSLPGLTKRQREVLTLMASGFGDTAIGRRLGISRKTVQNHISAIVAALQVHDRSGAVTRARAAGLGIPDASPG